MKQEMTGWR